MGFAFQGIAALISFLFSFYPGLHWIIPWTISTTLIPNTSFIITHFILYKRKGDEDGRSTN